MKKTLIMLLALMITAFMFVACSEGGNIQDESSNGAGSMISSVVDKLTSDVSGAESDMTGSSGSSSSGSEIASGSSDMSSQ